MGFRFSIRTALLGLTAAAGFSLVLAQCVRGAEWAVGVTFGVASLLAVFLVHAFWYLVVRVGGGLLSRVQPGPEERPGEKA